MRAQLLHGSRMLTKETVMKNLLIAALLMLTGLCAHAQKGTISGILTDENTGETLINANIIVSPEIGTTTNLDGFYELVLDPGNYTVEFKYIGYETRNRKVKIDAGTEQVLNIMLSSESEELGLVTVTGGKYAKKIGEEVVSIEVLKPEFISNSNSFAIDDALDKVPGVNMVGEQINIRGGSGFSAGASSRVMVLMDGLPMLKPDNGGADFSSLPMENIEQVEIIKGASSALYGSSALNGIVNLITAYPRNEPYTKVTMFYGLYENPFRGSKKELIWWDRNPMFGGFSFGHRKKFKQVDLVIGANYLEDENYLYGNKQRRINANVKVRYRPKNNPGLTLGLNTNMSSSSGGFFFVWTGWQDAPDSVLTDERVGKWKEYIDSLDAGLRPRSALRDSMPKDGLAYIPTQMSTFQSIPISFDPYLTYFDKRNNMHSLKGRLYLTYYQNSNGEESNANMAYGEYTFNSAIKRLGLNFVTGVSSFYTFITSDNVADGKKDGTNAAAFLQVDKRFWDMLTLNFGVRTEYNRTDSLNAEVKPIVRGGFNLQVTESTFLRGSYGQGYRFPTVTERFVRTERSGVQVIPNPDAQPEYGWSAELGIKQGLKVTKDWIGYFDVAGFVTQYTDMLEYVLQTDQPGLFYKAINLTDARISGIETSIFGQGKILGIPTNILVGYTYLVPIDLNAPDSLSQKESMLNFRFQHSAKADMESTVKKVTVGITATFVSFMENIGEIEGKGNIAGYRDANSKGEFVVDARIGYNLTADAKVSLIAKNLANNQYTLRPGFMEPPRNYALQVAYQF